MSHTHRSIPNVSKHLADEQLRAPCTFWKHLVLLQEPARRQDGLDDEEFDDLGAPWRDLDRFAKAQQVSRSVP
jgi:hypothetical protein